MIRTHTPSTRPSWPQVVGAVVAVAAVLTVGTLAGAAMGPSGGPVHATIRLGKPHYLSLVCGASSGAVYYLTSFPVVAVSGPVTTADFRLAIISGANATVPALGFAPPATHALPCGAPPPTGWYLILEPREISGTVADFPAPDAYGPAGVGWSNSTLDGPPVQTGGAFWAITRGDPTGGGDRIVATGMDGSSVELTGNTTFPGFMNP